MKTGRANTSYLLLILFALILSFDSCSPAPQGKQPVPDTAVQVDTVIKNLGEIVQFKAVETIFKIKNVGNYPLSISDVTADCHCTVPAWDTSLVQPGDYAEIKVKYDAHGLGIFQQAVNVDLNSKEKHLTCLIRGKVIEGNKK